MSDKFNLDEYVTQEITGTIDEDVDLDKQATQAALRTYGTSYLGDVAKDAIDGLTFNAFDIGDNYSPTGSKQTTFVGDAIGLLAGGGLTSAIEKRILGLSSKLTGKLIRKHFKGNLAKQIALHSDESTKLESLKNVLTITSSNIGWAGFQTTVGKSSYIDDEGKRVEVDMSDNFVENFSLNLIASMPFVTLGVLSHAKEKKNIKYALEKTLEETDGMGSMEHLDDDEFNDVIYSIKHHNNFNLKSKVSENENNYEHKVQFRTNKGDDIETISIKHLTNEEIDKVLNDDELFNETLIANTKDKQLKEKAINIKEKYINNEIDKEKAIKELNKIEDEIIKKENLSKVREIIKYNKDDIGSVVITKEHNSEIKELKDKIDNLKSINDIKTLISEIAQDDKEKENIISQIDSLNVEPEKEKVILKKVKDLLKANISDKTIHFNSKVNSGWFLTKIKDKPLVQPKKAEYNKSYLTKENIKENHLINKLSIAAYTLEALNKFKDKDINELRNLSFNDIIKAIKEPEIITNDAIVRKYHRNDIINIKDADLENLKIKSKVPIDSSLKKEVETEILKDLEELEQKGISSDEFLSLSDKKQTIKIDRDLNLSYFKSLKDYLTKNQQSKIVQHLLNIDRHIAKSIKLIRDITGQNIDIKQIFDIRKQLVNDVEKSIIKMYEDIISKTTTYDENIDYLISKLVKEENGEYRLKKEFKALLEITARKKLFNLFKDLKVVKGKSKEFEEVVNIYLDSKDLNIEKLTQDIFKKALIDLGLKIENSEILIEEIKRNIPIETDSINNLKSFLSKIINSDEKSFDLIFKESQPDYVLINSFKKLKRVENKDIKITKTEIFKEGKTQFTNIIKDINDRKITEEQLKNIEDNIVSHNLRFIKTYNNDFLGISNLLDPSVPKAIDKKSLKMIELKDGKIPKVVVDYAKLRGLINQKSKALLNRSELSLVKAMSNVKIKFKSGQFFDDSIREIENSFTEFNDIISKIEKNKATKQDIKRLFELFKFQKAHDGINLKDDYLKQIMKVIDSSNLDVKDLLNELDTRLNGKLFDVNNGLIALIKEYEKDFKKMKSYKDNFEFSNFTPMNNISFSGRIMQDGDLHLQSNRYSKVFLHFDDYENLFEIAKNFDSKNRVGVFKDKKEAEKYIISSIKTAIDEIDGLDVIEDWISKQEPSKQEKLKQLYLEPFRIDTGKIKIDKSNKAKFKDYLRIVNKLVELKDEIPNSYKKYTYIQQLEYLNKELKLNNFLNPSKRLLSKIDPTKLIAEFDGNQNMYGVMNAIIGIKDDATGIDGEIYKAKNDMYTEHSELLENTLVKQSIDKSIRLLIPEVSRSDAKKPTQALGYGQAVKNTLKDFIYSFIENKIFELGSENNYIDSRLNFFLEELTKQDNRYLRNFKSKELKDELKFLKKKLIEFIALSKSDKIDNKIEQAKKIGLFNEFIEENQLSEKEYYNLLSNLKKSFVSIDMQEMLFMKIKNTYLELMKGTENKYDLNPMEELMLYKEYLNMFEDVINQGLLDESTIKTIKQTIDSKITTDSFKDRLAEMFTQTHLNSYREELYKNDKFSKYFKFRDLIESLYKKKYLLTLYAVNQKAKNHLQLIEKIGEELGLTKEDIENIKKEFIDKEPTYKEIFDEFKKNGFEVFGSPTAIRESGIQTVKTPFGRELLPFTNGPTGYDEKTKITYKNMAIISKPLTYFVQSTESDNLGLATLMASNSKQIKGIVHRFDATYGLQGMRVGELQNDIYGAMFVDTKWLEDLKKDVENTNKKILELTDRLGSLDSFFEQMAKELVLVNNGRITTQKEVDFAKKNLLNDFLNSINIVYDDKTGRYKVKDVEKLSELIDEISSIKKETLKQKKDNDIITTQQFSNGIIESKKTKKELNSLASNLRKENKLKITNVKERATIEQGTLTENDLKNIDITAVKDLGFLTKFSSEYFKGFKFERLENSSIDESGNIRIEPESVIYELFDNGISKSEFIDLGKKIKFKLPKKITNLDEFYQLVHEVTHSIIHKKDMIDYDKLRNDLLYLFEKIQKDDFDLVLNVGSYGNVKLSDYYNFQKKKYSNISDSDIQKFEEFETAFIHSLVGNEIIKANKEKLAYFFSKNQGVKGESFVSLDGNLQKILVIKKDKTTEISTIKDLKKVLNVKFKTDGIDSVGSKILGIINTNDDIKSLLIGEKPFNKTSDLEIIDKINKNVEFFISKVTFKQEGFAKNLGLLDLFDLTQDKVKLNEALAIYNGAMSMLQTTTAEIKEYSESLIKEIEPVEWEKTDKSLGYAITKGLNFLIKEVTNITAIKEFDDELNISFKEMLENQEQINDFSKRKLISLKEKMINLYGMKNTNKIFNIADKINKTQDAIKKVDLLRKLAKEIATIHNNMGKDLITYTESLVIARKIISLKMLSHSKNTDYNKLRDFLSLYKNNKHNEVNRILYMFNQDANDFSLFGENISLDFLKNQQNVALIETKPENESDLIATIRMKDKTYYAIPITKYDMTLGRQKPQLLTLNLDDFERGIFERKINGVYVQINPHNINYASKNIDYSFSSQHTRNNYVKMKQQLAKNEGYEIFKILRDEGFLLSKKEIEQRIAKNPSLRNKFEKLPDNHYLSTMFGTGFYIDKSYKHYILGTKGIDLNKIDNNFIKALSPIIKFTADFTKYTSHQMLILNPRFWISNFLTNFMIFTHHSSLGPLNYVTYHNKAKKTIKELKDKIKQIAKLEEEINKLEFENKTTESIKLKKELEKLKKELKEQDGYLALKYGLGLTIREDIMTLGSEKELTMFHMIENNFGKDIKDGIKWLSFDPEENSLGKKFSEVFDNSEIIPKMALFLHLKDKYNDPEMAVKHTLLAFPRYNNLPAGISIISEFVPYTKFMLSYPKILMFALMNNVPKYITMSLFLTNMPDLLSEPNDSQDEWYIDHNIVMIGDIGLNINSMVSLYDIDSIVPFVGSPIDMYEWIYDTYTLKKGVINTFTPIINQN